MAYLEGALIGSIDSSIMDQPDSGIDSDSDSDSWGIVDQPVWV